MDLNEIINRSDDSCAREPIHLAGAIQPHGVVLVIKPDQHQIVAKSSNADQFLTLWPDAAWATACTALLQSGKQELDYSLPLGNGAQIQTHLFRSQHHVYLEFQIPTEPLNDVCFRTHSQTMADAIEKFRQAVDVEDLADMAVHSLAELSGYQRILIYRFSENGDGEVIAETLTAAWPQSLMGLRFPASDIPAQARALYTRTTARWLPCRDYQPVMLEPSVLHDGHPHDLSLSHYRSLSPIHRLYQKNIGADGSVSVSIMVDGKLWGLVIGHHHQPHPVPVPVQQMVIGLTRAFALRLEGLEAQFARKQVLRDTRAYSAMLCKLAGSDDFISALTHGTPRVIDLLPNCSGAAVIWQDDQLQWRVRVQGETPPVRALLDLTGWLRDNAQERMFSTDRLPELFPAFQSYRDKASGVMAGFFEDDHRPALLLFRAEILKTVAWAGKPEKIACPQGGPDLPRRSFERWEEVWQGHSQPWLDWEHQVMSTICTTINQVILRQSRRINELDTEVNRFTQALALSGTTLYYQDIGLRYQWVHNPHIGFATKIPGLTDWDVYDAELAERLVAVKRQVLISGQGQRLAIPSKHDDPKAEWFDLSIEPVRDNTGAVTGIACTGIRITDQKHSEDAIKRSESILRQVQQIARLGYYVYDVEQDHWESSAILDELLGIDDDFPRDAAHGFQLLAPEMRTSMQQLMDEMYQGERRAFQGAFRILRPKDGQERWISSIGQIECRSDGRPMRLIGTILDITDRIQAEQLLRKAHDELAVQTKELGQFAYVVSHDLREPLRMITAYLGLLSKRLAGRLQGDEQEFFLFATDGARRMDRLILDLLDYSRTGRQSAPPQLVKLNEIIGEARQNLAASIEDAGAELHIDPVLPEINGNRLELMRLFQNLIGNAVKYRQAGRAPVISISSEGVPDGWLLRIQDNGIGLAPEDHERAFAVFQRLVNREEYEGTGIGLAICRKIVEQHGGRIWVESQLGQGATFFIRLPRHGIKGAEPPNLSNS